jgi:hypothetical protein
MAIVVLVNRVDEHIRRPAGFSRAPQASGVSAEARHLVVLRIGPAVVPGLD